MQVARLLDATNVSDAPPRKATIQANTADVIVVLRMR
jgi:hypothetical protein